MKFSFHNKKDIQPQSQCVWLKAALKNDLLHNIMQQYSSVDSDLSVYKYWMSADSLYLFCNLMLIYIFSVFSSFLYIVVFWWKHKASDFIQSEHNSHNKWRWVMITNVFCYHTYQQWWLSPSISTRNWYDN